MGSRILKRRIHRLPLLSIDNNSEPNANETQSSSEENVESEHKRMQFRGTSLPFTLWTVLLTLPLALYNSVNNQKF